MKFTPDYTVSYKGSFYDEGETFDIDPSDADEMSQHGEIEDEKPVEVEENNIEKAEITMIQKRRGRPPKIKG